MPFVKSKCPLPTRSLRLLRAAVRSTTSALWLHYACKRSSPFVQDSGFVSHVERHRFGHGVVVSKVCYGILERVFPICHAIAMSRDWAFSNSGLEVWLPAFQLSMFDILAFCEIEVSSPYQKLEVPESGSTLYQLCIMVASCPSLGCSCRKNLSHAEKQRVWSRSSGLEDLLRNIPISDGSMWPLWPLQNTEWFWRLRISVRWVGSGAASLSAASVRKMRLL